MRLLLARLACIASTRGVGTGCLVVGAVPAAQGEYQVAVRYTNSQR